MSKKFSNIASLVREGRSANNLSQVQLSEVLGYKNGQFISNVERGLCSIPISKINSLAKAIKTDSNIIVTAMVADEEAYLRSIIQR